MRGWGYVKMKGFVGPSPLGEGQGKGGGNEEEGDWDPEKNEKRVILAIGIDGK
jgi:hypothetical protein